ncbi:MAG: conserved oligomeric Golgi complex subunit 4, partial [Staphylococcus equorum]|nr:conserved oligomeric Golgi complex subunit 4 [Staphylococcus equorum]
MEHATTEEELYTILKSIQEQDDIVTGKLNNFISTNQFNQKYDINQIDLLKSQLGIALTNSHEISKLLANTAYGAGRISSKVRSIEKEKSRVTDALKYVEDTILLKDSISGCHNAMEHRDWEKAAQYVHQAMSLPDDLVDGEFAKAKVPSIELPVYPRDSINEAANSLGALFMREFQKAANNKDMENLTRYFKLFPLCGQEKQGLDA